MSKENPFYKKLSYRITREGSKYPFRNDYTYKLPDLNHAKIKVQSLNYKDDISFINLN